MFDGIIHKPMPPNPGLSRKCLAHNDQVKMPAASGSACVAFVLVRFIPEIEDARL